jgi:hypothetical protein
MEAPGLPQVLSVNLLGKHWDWVGMLLKVSVVSGESSTVDVKSLRVLRSQVKEPV